MALLLNFLLKVLPFALYESPVSLGFAKQIMSYLTHTIVYLRKVTVCKSRTDVRLGTFQIEALQL
jgi:hypothetical protein